MMAERTVWTGNEHIQVDWSRVQKGDVVDVVPTAPVSCDVLVGAARWHVMTTIPQREATAAENLRLAGFRSRHLKVYRREPRGPRGQDGKRVMVEVERAMFPGYVLCDLREGRHDFKAAVSTKGVRDFLRDEGRPCVVPAKAFALMEQVEADLHDRYLASIAPKPKIRTDLVVGESVRVTEGPFAGFNAEIARLDDRGRVEVLLSLFGRSNKAFVDGAILEKV